jgi:hypothetical protein
MRLAHVVLMLLLTVCLAAGTALAGPPLSGVWNSTDIGGDVLTARYMEGYADPYGATSVGTTLNAQSWDGMNLGTQWSYSCGVIESAPTLLSDTVVNGTGTQIWAKHFIGGEIWLAGDGPWGNGDPYYSGPILSYVEYETVQYVNGDRVHAVTNISAKAQLDGYGDSCLAFTVGNGVEIGSTDFGDPVPADYPPMLAAYSCNPTMMNGAWWDFTQLSLYVDSCTVPNEDTTWGALKSMYR